MSLADYTKSYFGGTVRLIQVVVCWKGFERKEVEKELTEELTWKEKRLGEHMVVPSFSEKVREKA